MYQRICRPTLVRFIHRVSADKAVNITIKCNTNAGGFIGLVDQSSNIMISECSVVNSSISAASINNAGAYLGSFGRYDGKLMKIVKSNVSNVNVNAPSYFGIIVGFKLTAYSVSTSMPYDNNFVNSVKQPNCPNFADSCNSTTNISASDIYSAVTYNDLQFRTLQYNVSHSYIYLHSTSYQLRTA
ncbi:Hypothetical_protein [Hexamita inflata]|uniref:Hypothetical_protein n=1 Tax=Hexamita inflata TaxID=28002 RepID=A0AA86R6B1_9EUKA|nr:Hypothetical protein HINF_LOCUS59015 [Hexamita inflata]